MDKIDRIVEELLDKGFSMTREEFQETRLYRILETYDISENLNLEEYLQLAGKLYLLCE